MHDIGDLRCRKSHFFQFLIMGKYILRCIVKHHFPMIHNDQAFHIFGNVLHAMRNQDNGNSSHLMKSRNLIQNVISSLWVEPCSRLIQDQDFRVHCQNTCNGNPFLLAS